MLSCFGKLFKTIVLNDMAYKNSQILYDISYINCSEATSIAFFGYLEPIPIGQSPSMWVVAQVPRRKISSMPNGCQTPSVVSVFLEFFSPDVIVMQQPSSMR